MSPIPNKFARLFHLVAMLSSSLMADTLVYPNGDRAEGTLISQQNGIIVFSSKHFGRIEVGSTDAIVEIGERAAGTIAADVTVVIPADPKITMATDAASAGEQHGRLFRWLGPWKGRIAFALEMAREANERDSVVIDTKLERKWAKDEVKLESRYEYRETDEVKNTDLLKGTAHWRHDLSRNWFALYRSSGEWNRYYHHESVLAPYVLLQQELGAGVTFASCSDRSLRVGLAENLFHLWVDGIGVERSENTESAFTELELKLPWGSRLIDRGVIYYSITSGDTGWENTLELNRKLSRSVSLGLRHEYRRNVPDVRVQDYRNLRLLLGFDF